MNFNKVGLIIRREYLTRVRKKTFLISTILTPLSIILLMFASGYLSSGALSKQQNILVLDRSGVFQDQIRSNSKVLFTYGDPLATEQKEKFKEKGFDAYIEIPQFDRTMVIDKLPVEYTSDKKPGISILSTFNKRLESVLKSHNLKIAGYDQVEIDKLKPEIDLNTNILNDKEESDEVSNANLAVGSALGGVMGFLMYLILIIYGSFVMRSVMEEKINRIVEVVISSVKPFELMLGKILGVGAVGFTQIIVWIFLLTVGYLVVGIFFGMDPSTMANTAQVTEALGELEAATEPGDMQMILTEIANLNWWLIIPCFFVFFIMGFLMYSSLFAAVGSAIGDDMNEGNSLTFVIMIPIIFSMMLLFPTLEDPHGTMGIFGSLFPLTAPVIMPARLAFDPPIWQVIVSMFSVIFGALFFVWLSGKIYRAGILLYGKKLSFKNLMQIMKG